jgi:ribose transport system substrate-binding protein
VTSLINRILDDGIPVFTFGVPREDFREFRNFAQVPLLEGVKVAEGVLEWMDANGKDFKTFAVSSALPAEVWAQGRMISFVDTIKAAIPDAVFVTDSTNGLDTTLDPTTTYDRVSAFLIANPEVEVLMNTDIGSEHIDRVIVDLGLAETTYSVGWNPSKANLDFVEDGVQIAVYDQDIARMSGRGPRACAQFAATGEIWPYDIELSGIFAEDVPEWRERLGFE